MSRYQALIICTSPRSGSTFLCRLLQATGKAGLPDSHFHEPSVAAWLEDHGLSATLIPTEYAQLVAAFDAARASGTGDTGLFGLRLQRHSVDFFLQKLAELHPGLPTDTARLETAFGKILYIHLTRPDKIDQAVSRLKAEQSGLWHRAPDGPEIERLSPPPEQVYDAGAIARHVAEMSADDTAWAAWFAREGVVPHRISYDDLSRAPLVVLAGVLEALGLERSLADGIALPTAKLADAVSRTWAARFRAETGA